MAEYAMECIFDPKTYMKMNDPVKSCVSEFKNTDTKRKFTFPAFSILEEGRNIGVFLKPRVVS